MRRSVIEKKVIETCWSTSTGLLSADLHMFSSIGERRHGFKGPSPSIAIASTNTACDQSMKCAATEGGTNRALMRVFPRVPQDAPAR